MSATRRWQAPGTRGPGVCVLHGPGDDGQCLATISGGIDHQNVAVLHQALSAAMEAGSRITTLDMCAVTFVDPTVLHALLDAQRAHRARGARLQLRNATHPVVERLLDITGARTYFTFATTEEAHRRWAPTRARPPWPRPTPNPGNPQVNRAADISP